jgi:hypothetical protein
VLSGPLSGQRPSRRPARGPGHGCVRERRHTAPARWTHGKQGSTGFWIAGTHPAGRQPWFRRCRDSRNVVKRILRRHAVVLVAFAAASCAIEPLPPRDGPGAIGVTGTGCLSAPSPGTVVFCDGKARGAMTGYGWVELGALDTITDPTCDADRHAITNESPCTSTINWRTADSLCLSGSIPALHPTAPDYDHNWFRVTVRLVAERDPIQPRIARRSGR